ncbi:glycosyltransferase family 2 protein [Candidatus Woesebacteria bacterium]|nr:glycosyltransferase family 2 protein [Candidatus Woesebacteria bacterium]
MKLSLCIATFNEEHNIHYALDSAYDIADEVIIVDGNSTDKTVEIVKSYGLKVKVFNEQNPRMFHINKQKAIERAKGEWILQLDADEALSEDLKKDIVGIVSQKKGNTSEGEQVAYWIPRKNYFLGRFLEKGGIYPDETIRLYKNGVARFPCKTVHENVAVKGAVGRLRTDLLHYADPTFERYLMRWNRYTSLEARERIKKKKHLCAPCYFIGKPIATFLSIYFRHQGFRDGFPGFVWALFSAIRFWAVYIKVYFHN